MNADFAVRQGFGSQPRRVGRQHFLASVHEDDHASLKGNLRNHRAETERPANLTAGAAVCGQDSPHVSALSGVNHSLGKTKPRTLTEPNRRGGFHEPWRFAAECSWDLDSMSRFQEIVDGSRGPP